MANGRLAGAAQEPTRRGARLARWLGDPATPLGCAVAFAAAGCLVSAWSRLNYDVAWLLTGARRLLEGAALYGADFVDVNPPLAVYLLTPASALASASGIGEPAALRLQAALFSLLALVACMALLRRVYGEPGRQHSLWWLAGISFLAFISPGLSLGTEAVAYGQREHWILLLALPYLVVVALRLQGGSIGLAWGWGAGVALGLAVSMKPHYAALWLSVEALRFALQRDLRGVLRSETLAVPCVGLLYLLLVWLTAPGYFTTALPLALNTYWAYQAPLLDLIGIVPIALLGLGLLAVRWVPAEDPARSLAMVFLAAALGAYAAYLLGGTTWTYHLLPFRGLILLVLLAPVIARLPLASTRPSAGGRLLHGAAAAGVVLVALTFSPNDSGRILRAAGDHGASGLSAKLEETIRARGAGGPAVVLATSVPPGFPAVTHVGVDWTLRHSSLWALPALLRARAGDPATPSRMDEGETNALEDYLRRTLAEDFERRPPTLVFVFSPGWLQGIGRSDFDLLTFLRLDPRFAEIWEDYRPIGQIGPVRTYERAVGRQPLRTTLPGD